MTDPRIDMGSTEDVAWLLHREILDDLPVVLRMVYDGEPVSKSRARFTGRGSKTRAYTPEKTRTAEDRIAELAREAGITGEPDADHSFGIFAKFFCGTWQRRDVDNMLKLVSDALTKVVWADDSQVSEMSASVQRGVGDPRTHVLIYQTPAPRNPTKPCEVCGTPVRQYRSQPNRYCSKEHANIGQQIQVELTCVLCATVYKLPRARATRVKTPYCSERCRYQGTVVVRPCENCGTTVTRPKSQTKSLTYCSKPCADAGKVGRPRGGAA